MVGVVQSLSLVPAEYPEPSAQWLQLFLSSQSWQETTHIWQASYWMFSSTRLLGPEIWNLYNITII